MREQTIAAAVDFTGIGLHTGQPAAMRILPAPARAGIVTLESPRNYIHITKTFTLEENGKTISIHPSETFRIEYQIGFSHPLIGDQKVELEMTPANYARLVAPARTFGFYHEVEMLQASGLIRGGSLENAIVLTETGMLNETSLRFSDEFVRHKVLDLLGDFALIGAPVLGRLTANRAGHALHTRFVAELLDSTGHWTISSRHRSNIPPTVNVRP